MAEEDVLNAIAEVKGLIQAFTNGDDATKVNAHVVSKDATVGLSEQEYSDGYDLLLGSFSDWGISSFDPTSQSVDIGSVGGNVVNSVDDFKADYFPVSEILVGETFSALFTTNIGTAVSAKLLYGSTEVALVKNVDFTVDFYVDADGGLWHRFNLLDGSKITKDMVGHPTWLSIIAAEPD